MQYKAAVVIARVSSAKYGSVAQIWEKQAGVCPPYLPGLQHCHIGSLNVVRGMWERLGLSMDWSLAIHPYGNPLKVISLHLRPFSFLLHARSGLVPLHAAR